MKRIPEFQNEYFTLTIPKKAMNVALAPKMGDKSCPFSKNVYLG